MAVDADTPDPESPAAIEREIAQTRARLGETLSALELRISPEYLMEQAMAYLREEASEWGAEIGTFVRRNPLPFAVLGVGLAWLAVSLLRDRNEDDAIEYAAGPEGLYGPVYDEEDEDERDHRRSAHRRGRGRRAASDAIDDARAETEARAHELSDRVGEWAHEARDRLDHLAEDARARLSHAAADAIGQASRVGTYARDGVDRLQREVVRAADERPLLLGAIGIGLGALVALCLPGTRAESRLIGPRRDELLDEMREAGRERLHGVMEAVRHAGEAAMDQAEEEGLSRRGVSRTLEKAQRVAETALDTAAEGVEAQVTGEPRRSATRNGKVGEDKDAEGGSTG